MKSKGLGRVFNKKEGVILAILVILILGWVYYLTVDVPVRSGIREARQETEALETEAMAAEARVENVRYMLANREAQGEDGYSDSYIPSYNASNAELDFLNDTLSHAEDYYIGFSNLTREGDLIRRSFSLQYRASSYEAAMRILKQVEDSENRCLISDYSVTPAEDSASILSGKVQVSCQATFYETMFEGKEDADLPEDPTALQALEAELAAGLD